MPRANQSSLPPEAAGAELIKLPLRASLRTYEAVLGKPDTSWVSHEECGFTEAETNGMGDSLRILRYGPVHLTALGDSADLYRVELDAFRHEVMIRSTRLNWSTTLDSVEQYLPEAFAHAYELGSGENLRTMVRLPVGPWTDGEWALTFRAGWLVELEQWYPC